MQEEFSLKIRGLLLNGGRWAGDACLVAPKSTKYINKLLN